MRVGLFKPVHVKTLAAQEQRMLLTSRKLLQRKLVDLELRETRRSHRGTDARGNPAPDDLGHHPCPRR
jgi:transposase